ncbi:alpha/beta-hydrolase [Epithele typhae]|uniref:alpha/beta-hydrolase n=1 Tax=Epithele typhae TaxID=378194 RepID=UPI00200872A2|nr:alpha/beta-hydrolase [Epithele typhae]KAH9945221.1 alpha/beta-hydrolase [Epithele typhae]
MAAREQLLTSPDGTRIWAESAGDASQPAIVFVHGLSCTARGWDAQFADPALLRAFHLVRYEMRGHGRSGKPVDEAAYASDRIAADFKTVCDAFAVVRPIMAGWSLGGAIAVDVVTAYGADYLAGIIYIGGSIVALHYHGPCKHPRISEIIPYSMSPDADQTHVGAELFVDSCVKAPLPYATKLEWMGGFIVQPRLSRHWSINRAQDHTVWEASARGIPVVIIQGTEDEHCVYENMISRAKTVYADVEVHLLEDVGHSPHFERPEVANELMLEWALRKTAAA